MSARQPWQEWSLVARGGRRSPRLAWKVRTVAGDTVWLSGIQRQVLSYAGAAHAHGRHRWTIRGAAEALGVAPSTVSRAIVRLRSLSLLGAYRPTRGRNGGVLTWIPSGLAAARDRSERRVRWPSRGNVATLTTFGGSLTREGLRRAWRTVRSGRPPGPRPPGGGPAVPARIRARGRPWPPPYVDEACPSRGHRRERLTLRSVLGSGSDQALVYGGRGSRCRRDHAAAVVLVDPGRRSPTRADGRGPDPARFGQAATPARAALAAAALPLLTSAPIRENLAIAYLGFRRGPVHEPVLPAIADGAPGELAALVAGLERRCRRELELVRESRRLVPPA